MKVVFLDFDGVVVPCGKLSLIDKMTVESVKNVCALLEREPDLHIVVSSTWRHHGFGYCRRFLQHLGIDSKRMIDMTGFEDGDRGHQIQCYLDREPQIKQFVILDDNSDMGPLMNKLVKTSSFIGLTAKDVDLAVEVLNA